MKWSSDMLRLLHRNWDSKLAGDSGLGFEYRFLLAVETECIGGGKSVSALSRHYST